VKLVPGVVYKDKDGNRCRVLRLGFKVRCQVTGEWFKGVMYEPADLGMDLNYGNGPDVCVRTQKDFCAEYTRG
jgi:hypothetical protein